MSDFKTTELPPGYRVLNDGPGREVLTHDSWETGNVFDTVAQAAAYARWLEGVSVSRPSHGPVPSEGGS